MAYAFFWLQLLVNFLWSLLFFGLQNPFWALIDVVVLFGLILATIASFRPHSALAAWLLVPYSIWVAFATVLNAAIWVLNS